MSEYGAQDIVEIVGNSPSKLSNRLHFLGLAKVGFQLSASCFASIPVFNAPFNQFMIGRLESGIGVNFEESGTLRFNKRSQLLAEFSFDLKQLFYAASFSAFVCALRGLYALGQFVKENLQLMVSLSPAIRQDCDVVVFQE